MHPVCVPVPTCYGRCPKAPFAEDKRVFSPPTLHAFATHSQVRMATIPASSSARLASRAAALCSASLPHPSALGEPENKKAFSKRSFGCMRPRTGVNRSERTNNKEAKLRWRRLKLQTKRLRKKKAVFNVLKTHFHHKHATVDCKPELLFYHIRNRMHNLIRSDTI